MSDISDRLLNDIVDAVKDLVRKEQSDRLRDIYLIGDIDKDSARGVIERLRELANESRRPITLYINSAGGNVTDGLALHDTIAQLVSHRHHDHHRRAGDGVFDGIGRAAGGEPGRRWAFPHSWIMIHEPAKWAGWQSTTAAAQHLDRLKQMQDQIYRILADRSGQAAAPDHPRHEAHRLLSGRGARPALRADRPGHWPDGAGGARRANRAGASGGRPPDLPMRRARDEAAAPADRQAAAHRAEPHPTPRHASQSS